MVNQFTSDGGQINLKSSISGALTFENDITLNGNLVVLGDTFSASVGTLLIEDALINIGDGQGTYADGYGIEFGTFWFFLGFLLRLLKLILRII